MKIVRNNTEEAAKIVLVDNKNRVLMLKRGRAAKHPEEWDLPGGYIRENESINAGLLREIKEETGLSVKKYLFFKKIENISFFFAMYDSQPIKLSHEHTDYAFFDKKKLDFNDKFQKVSLEVLEKVEK
jgi:8-oxo-dGTP pyrophosphatase MutT (NUDIX family)